MKISNILFATAAVIALSTLVAYNFGLKAEYQTLQKSGVEKYKKANRFNNFEEITVEQFNSIDLKAANSFNVSIEYGDKQAVWINKYARPNIQINQLGKRLIVDLSRIGKENNYNNYNSNVVIISPKINQVITSPFTFSKTTKGATGDNTRTYFGAESGIYGFTQDSMSLNISPLTKFRMNYNTIKSLNATIGDNTGAGELIIKSENKITAVSLTVNNSSRVEILDDDIEQFRNTVSDQATVTLRGVALSKLTK